MSFRRFFALCSFVFVSCLAFDVNKAAFRQRKSTIGACFAEACRANAVYMPEEGLLIDLDGFNRSFSLFSGGEIVKESYDRSERYVYPTYVSSLSLSIRFSSGLQNYEFGLSCRIERGTANE